MQNRNQLFDFAVCERATDIHICAGAPVQFRIGGKLVPVMEEHLSPEKSQLLCLGRWGGQGFLENQKLRENLLSLSPYIYTYRDINRNIYIYTYIYIYILETPRLTAASSDP